MMLLSVPDSYPGLWMVAVIIAAGIVSNELLSGKPINLRWLSGDLLRGGLVALIIWAWSSASSCSLFQMIIIAGLSGIAWPYMISELIRYIAANIKRVFPENKR